MSGLRLSGGIAALSLIALAIAVTPAAAQHRGTEAEQEACTSDVFRLCSDDIPNETQIVSCLKANRTRLTPACYQVFYSAPPISTAVHHKRKRRHRAE